jgi:[NiFe] hydrogenase small subunit
MGMEDEVYSRLEPKGVSRREFTQFCGLMAMTLGLAPAMAPKIAEAVTTKMKPPIVWMHFAECTGCSEAFLRTAYPFADELILEILDVAYHETIMTAAGHQAEKSLHDALEKYKGAYFCVIEGGIPTGANGRYGLIGGRPMTEICQEAIKDALATICIGNCACFGGIQKALPNPTQAMGVQEFLGCTPGSPACQPVNISGCPPNPINFVATVVQFLLLDKLPHLDEYGRPLFAYGQLIHDNCPRRGHYEEGNYVKVFGDEGTRLGWCLYEMGCKGPETFNNCPILKYNQGTSWPIGAGYPCIGCSEPDFWDEWAPFFEAL